MMLGTGMLASFHDARTLWGVAALSLVIAASSRAFRRGSSEDYKRGVLVKNAGRRRPRLLFSGPSRLPPGFRKLPAVTVGGIPVPFADETRHFKMVGTTGTGKSTAIEELLGGALARGDRAVLADPDGGYRRRFFDRYRGDVILNPSERESVRWEPFDEINDRYDVERLAWGLIPDRRCVIERVARLCTNVPVRRSCAAARNCPAATSASCGGCWQSHPGRAEVCRGGHPRAALSRPRQRPHVRLHPCCGGFGARCSGTRSGQRAAPFSVRRWVRRTSETGVLFIPYRAGQIAALGAMIATWMRIAIFEAMNGERISTSGCGSWSMNSTPWGRWRGSRMRSPGFASSAAAASWVFSRSHRSQEPTVPPRRRRSSKTAAIPSSCAALRAKMEGPPSLPRSSSVNGRSSGGRLRAAAIARDFSPFETRGAQKIPAIST